MDLSNNRLDHTRYFPTCILRHTQLEDGEKEPQCMTIHADSGIIPPVPCDRTIFHKMNFYEKV